MNLQNENSLQDPLEMQNCYSQLVQERTTTNSTKLHIWPFAFA